MLRHNVDCYVLLWNHNLLTTYRPVIVFSTHHNCSKRNGPRTRHLAGGHRRAIPAPGSAGACLRFAGAIELAAVAGARAVVVAAVVVAADVAAVAANRVVRKRVIVVVVGRRRAEWPTRPDLDVLGDGSGNAVCLGQWAEHEIRPDLGAHTS